MKEQRESTREHGGSVGEQRESRREQAGAMGEQAGAEGEQMHETGDSAGAKRRGMSQQSVTGRPRFGGDIYIYIYFPPSCRFRFHFTKRSLNISMNVHTSYTYSLHPVTRVIDHIVCDHLDKS